MITTVWVSKDGRKHLFPNLSVFLKTYAFRPNERDAKSAHVKVEYLFETITNCILFGDDLYLEMFSLLGFDEAVVFRGADSEWKAVEYKDILTDEPRISKLNGPEAIALFNQAAANQTIACEGGKEKQGMVTRILGTLPALLKRS